jgi:zinc-finger-containing domain
MTRPHCPLCGRVSFATTTMYGVRNSCCGLWSWGEAPLVSRETHEARKAAHAAFDTIWKDGMMTRGQAYKALQKKLGMTSEECHMKLMDEYTALKVPQAAFEIRHENDVDVIE